MNARDINAKTVNPIANLGIIFANTATVGLITSASITQQFLKQALPIITGYQNHISIASALLAGVGTYFWLRKLDRTNTY